MATSLDELNRKMELLMQAFVPKVKKKQTHEDRVQHFNNYYLQKTLKNKKG